MRNQFIVIQSPRLDTLSLEQAAALVEAEQVKSLHSYAARFNGFNPEQVPALQQWADTHGFDLTILDEIKPLTSMKVLAMDMDSTLITIECIDEIAAVAGRKYEVATITEAAMRGEIIDFKESLKRRVAMLEGVDVSALEQVYSQRLRLNPGAEQLIKGVQQVGIKTLLVSGGFTFFTERMQQSLNLDYAYGNQLEIINGKLSGKVVGNILDGQAKANYLTTLAQQLGATPEQCIAVGDGSNDLLMLSHAYYSVAYHAKPLVQKQARFKINHNGLNAILNWFDR